MSEKPPLRTIAATWTFEEMRDIDFTPKIDISKLTEDEQADLIIDRLTNPPKRRDIEDEIAAVLSMNIRAEIDNAVLSKIAAKYGYK